MLTTPYIAGVQLLFKVRDFADQARDEVAALTLLYDSMICCATGSVWLWLYLTEGLAFCHHRSAK